MKTIILITLLTLCIAKASNVEVILPSHNFVSGEYGFFHILSYDKPLESTPKEIKQDGYTLTHQTTETFNTKSNGRVYAYIYSIEAFRLGKFETPIFQLHIDRFKKNNVTVAGRDYSYYSASFVKDKTLFEKQATSVEIRYLFPQIPDQVSIIQWGLATIDKSVNCYGWKPEPPERLSRQTGYDYVSSKLKINNTFYDGISYYSSLTALNEGEAMIGGFTMTCVAGSNNLSRNGMFIESRTVLELQAEATKATTSPLPPNSDPLFNGNVGVYKIDTDLPKTSTLKEDDSIKIKLTVAGTGDFQNITPPIMLEKEKWHVIDVTKIDNGNYRKSVNGNVTFEYLLSPLNTEVLATPKFALAYFNPDNEAFEKTFSKIKPITIKRSNNSSATLSTPLENQLNILSFLPFDDQFAEDSFKLPFSWHWFPISILIAIFFYYLFNLRKTYLTSKVDQIERKRELRLLNSTSHSEADFYKNVGNYIEKWIENDKRSSVQDLLEKRDQACFNPKPSDPKPIDKKTQNTAIKLLSKLSILIFIIVLSSLSSQVNAAESRLQEAQDLIDSTSYKDAIKILSAEDRLTANGHYNLGVCYYKTGEVGLASLEFHRALYEQSNHPEAHQNLKYIAKEYLHPNQLESKKLDKWISYYQKNTYLSILWISLWALAIILSVYFIIRPRFFSSLNFFILTSIVFSISILSMVAYQLYPKSIYFSNKSEMAVIITSQVKLQTEPITIDPTEGSKIAIVDLPIGSICRVIAKRAAWHYVELPSSTRGWIKSNQITKIVKPNPNASESAQP